MFISCLFIPGVDSRHPCERTINPPRAIRPETGIDAREFIGTWSRVAQTFLFEFSVSSAQCAVYVDLEESEITRFEDVQGPSMRTLDIQ